MSLRTRLISGLALLAMTPAAAGAQGLQASVILRNGAIVTQDGQDRTVPAIAVLKDRIVAAGSEQEVMALRGAGTCVVDLGGRTVTPGFADGHIHSKPEAFDESIVNLVPVRTMQELLDAVKAGVARAKPGEVVVTNSDWHEAQLKELRLPMRQDLDPVSGNTPVIVIRGGHEYILNSAALAKYGITRASKSPPGGKIGLDAKGEPTGELVDRARDLAPIPPRPPKSAEERLALLKQEQRRYNELGLTSVRNPGASIEQMLEYSELARRGEMTVRTSVLIRWDRRSSAADFKKELATWPVRSRFGDEWLRLDGIKLGVDGGYEGGWMTQAYAEPHGHDGTFFGLNTVPRQQFVEVVRMLNELDLRPSTHAVGDAAVDLVLEAYEAANRDSPIGGKRWAIEHAFITRGDQIPRVKQLGLVISAQSHLYLAAASLKEYWGPQRTAQVAPVRSWLDAGIAVAGGTDNKLPYVPEAPITTFYHWISRDTVSAGVQGPKEAITRKEALRIATLGNAYLTFEEGLKGSLEPGKLADLVVLSQNIMTVPANQVMQTKVLGAMVGGRFVFRAPEFSGCG